ncbi:hypothetical protein F511_35829 [Dorcoceras hygrometricum]|uniref:Uncharacterized protein n=1 Tax=Dorcoceras hygrometricum TaxID=472368 RepID=A0A2Z7D605_9LAMI|nr:hypothetical protein F511_35829 [Dorcoceras hygrometricum]
MALCDVVLALVLFPAFSVLMFRFHLGFECCSVFNVLAFRFLRVLERAMTYLMELCLISLAPFPVVAFSVRSVFQVIQLVVVLTQLEVSQEVGQFEESTGYNEDRRSAPSRTHSRHDEEEEVGDLPTPVERMDVVIARFQRMNPQVFNGDESSEDADSWLRNITGCEGERRYRTLISLLGLLETMRRVVNYHSSWARQRQVELFDAYGFPGYPAGRGADPARGAPGGESLKYSAVVSGSLDLKSYVSPSSKSGWHPLEDLIHRPDQLWDLSTAQS